MTRTGMAEFVGKSAASVFKNGDSMRAERRAKFRSIVFMVTTSYWFPYQSGHRKIFFHPGNGDISSSIKVVIIPGKMLDIGEDFYAIFKPS